MKSRLAAVLIRWIVQLIGFTCRYRFVSGAEHLQLWRYSGRPAVFSCWHNRVFFCADFLRRRLIREGVPLSILVSHSRDGEMGARLAQAWGAQVVRGSTSRGGSAGLRKIYRSVVKDGVSSVTLPDGPRGPLYEAQGGAVVLAQMCGIPIVPLAFASRRFWRLRSWDRIFVPKPFTRIDVVVGEPLEVPRQLAEGELDVWRLRLQDALNDCARKADGPGTDVPGGNVLRAAAPSLNVPE